MRTAPGSFGLGGQRIRDDVTGRKARSHLLHVDHDPVHPGTDWQLMLACPCDSVIWRGCNCRLSDSWALDFIWNHTRHDARNERVHDVVVEEAIEQITLS